MGVTLYSNIGTSAGTCNVVPSPLWSNVGGSCNVKSLYVSFTKTFDEIALKIRPYKSCLTKSCIRISGLQKGHAMMFRAQPGVIWLDIVMAKYYRHSLRRHLIKLHPRNDQITIVRRAIQVSFLHFDDDIHKKIDRRACQAKQPRVDAICGRKWWLSHSCHHQCDGSIVCPTGAVVLSRLFVHSGETLFVNWFVLQRNLIYPPVLSFGQKAVSGTLLGLPKI